MMLPNDQNSPDRVQSIRRRSVLLGGIQAAVVGLLGWRMHQLGVKQSDQFRLLADENRINIRLTPPARGLIYDRYGQPLTYNRRVYTIEMVREQARDPEAVLRRLANLIPLTPLQIDSVLEDMSSVRAFVPVTVATGLEWEHVAAVSANAPALPGITPRLALDRKYTIGPEYAHIIGYVGAVSDYDLDRLEDKDPLLLIPRFQIGKNGVEAAMEFPLRGKAGIRRIEVNSVGRVMRELDAKPSQPGTNLQLTIVPELQKFTLRRLADQSAGAVVMNVKNGDLLALASAPSFDPKLFDGGISVKDWKNLNENEYRPLANKTVQGTYSPGSTFKMVVALTALRLGLVSAEEEVHCAGHKEVSGRKFHCWRRGGHGKMNLREALRQSCDVYFYDIAVRVGIEEITKTAKELGLGIKHELPLPAVRSGLTPTKEWKKRVKEQDWFIGDTANAGIGQGFVLASPMQLAIMTARLASGTKIEPRLLNLVGDQTAPVNGVEALNFDPSHLNLVRRGMYDVVNHRRGTAYGSRLDLVEMAGKTGTTQVRAISKRERANGVTKNEDRPWKWRDHALFVGYAPYENPEYAVSVVVEHGGGGSKAAAPIARDIMRQAVKLSANGYGPLPSQQRSDTSNEDPSPA